MLGQLPPASAPVGARSQVIAAMRAAGVRKLVVQSSYGVGGTRDKLGLIDRLFFTLLLAPQIADTELQESAVRESGLDWVLVQPVHLTDAADDHAAFVSARGELSRMKVSRASVGRFLADAVESGEFVHHSVALSGIPVRPRGLSLPACRGGCERTVRGRSSRRHGSRALRRKRAFVGRLISSHASVSPRT